MFSSQQLFMFYTLTYTFVTADTLTFTFVLLRRYPYPWLVNFTLITVVNYSCINYSRSANFAYEALLTSKYLFS